VNFWSVLRLLVIRVVTASTLMVPFGLRYRGKALGAHRGDLELLRRALRQARSPYAEVIEAVCAQLPALRRPDLARIRQDGPPAEDVGLEPFAPPGYLAGTEASR
jgi:hypothetical protein